MNDEPILHTIAALAAFILLASVLLTVPVWGEWIDRLGEEPARNVTAWNAAAWHVDVLEHTRESDGDRWRCVDVLGRGQQ